MIKGVDISIIQGVVDFVALKNSGVDFVICRCGVGNSGIDGFYTRNITNAKAAGLKVACYHFLFPLPPLASQPLRDPVKQAQYHFNAAQGEIACIDCEWPAPEDFAKWGCTPAQLNQWMLTYLQEYERLSGRKPMVYTYPYWAAAVKFDPQFAQYPLWIASYQASPAIPHPWTGWTLWQTTGGGGHLPGSGVAVDTDAAQDLSSWDVAVPLPVVEPIPDHQPDPIPTPIAVVPVPVPIQPVPVQPASVVPPSLNILTTFWNLFINLFKRTN